MTVPRALRSLLGAISRFVPSALKRLVRAELVRTFEIAYVIFVSDEIHNYMTKLQYDILRRYGPNPGIRSTPHITLKLGFQVSNIEPFERYFDELVRETEPFEITVRNIGFFDEGIVFMDVEHTPPLDRLRRRILSDLAARFDIQPYPLEGDGYRFHATVAYGMAPQDFAAARASLGDLRVDFRFALKTLGMLCQTGDDSYEWMTYKRAVLARSSAPS